MTKAASFTLSYRRFLQSYPLMNLATRLKSLRRDLGLSQEAIGAQGFVSGPGWIKIENAQRQASEKLLERLTQWLVREKYLRTGAAQTLKEELLTLKYLGSRSAFVRELAKERAKTMANGAALLEETPISKPRRGRPPKYVRGDVALVAETAGVYKTKRNRQKPAR